VQACQRKRACARNRSKNGAWSVGWRSTCSRAAGSLGAWDLIGVSASHVVLLQVKSNRPPSPAEREALRLFVAPPNARKLIHVWHDRQRQPDVRTP